VVEALAGQSSSGQFLRREICHGVVHLVCHPYFQVEVGSSGPTGIADPSDPLTAANRLALFDEDLVEMGVIGVNALSVIDKDGISVSPESLPTPDEDHSAVRAGQDRVADCGCNVHTLMKSPPPVPEGRRECSLGNREFELGHRWIALAADGVGNGVPGCAPRGTIAGRQLALSGNRVRVRKERLGRKEDGVTFADCIRRIDFIDLCDFGEVEAIDVTDVAQGFSLSNDVKGPFVVRGSRALLFDDFIFWLM